MWVRCSQMPFLTTEPFCREKFWRMLTHADPILNAKCKHDATDLEEVLSQSRAKTPGRVCECLPRHPSGCGALHLFTLCQLQIAYRDSLINGQRNVMRWWATFSLLYFSSARVNRTALRQPPLFLTATLLQLSGGHNISKIKTEQQFVLGANQQKPAICISLFTMNTLS